MVPFSSDFPVTTTQDISEWLSSSCMATLCMSPLADPQHFQLAESSSSLHPWFLACDCRVHWGFSHSGYPSQARHACSEAWPVSVGQTV